MGLGFHIGGDHSACKASFSYGGFTSFRRRLAKSVGLDLDWMQGFFPEPQRIRLRNYEVEVPQVRDPWAVVPFNSRSWSSVDDPIAGLLNHSDCSGTIEAKSAALIAARLREILATWPDSGYDPHKEQGLLLAEGLETAAARKKPLTFC